jgi:hypothetical protein
MIKDKAAVDKIAKKALVAAFKSHIDAAWNGNEKPWWDKEGITFGLESEPIVGPSVVIQRNNSDVIQVFLCDAIIGNKKLMNALGDNSYEYRLKCPLFEKVIPRSRSNGPEL